MHEPVVCALPPPDGEDGADDGAHDEADGEGDPHQGHPLAPRLWRRVVRDDRRGQADVALREPPDNSAVGIG